MSITKIQSDFEKEYVEVGKLFSTFWEIAELLPSKYLFQKFVFVLDANVVLADLRYSVLNERSTYLQFCLTYHLAAFYAPLFLKEEIVKNIPKLAIEKPGSECSFNEKWGNHYLPFIYFIKEIPNVSSFDYKILEVRDPKDVQYKAASEILQADNLLTEDKDYGAYELINETYPAKIIIDLRHYAVNSVKTTKIIYEGSVVLTLAIAGIVTLLKLIRKYPIFGIVGVGIFIYLWNNPKKKAYLESIKKLFKDIIAEEAIQDLMSILSLSNTYNKKVETNRAVHRRYKTLKQYAYRVIIEFGKPIELKELQKIITARGYKRKSVNNNSYLVRILLKDSNIKLEQNMNGQTMFSLNIIK
jgi:hypothetical protein